MGDLKADQSRHFGVDGDEAMLLPVLRFSYYKILTDRKLEILRVLFGNPQCCASLEELSKKTGMSLPLIDNASAMLPKE